MIVVDTNIIGYLYLSSERSPTAEQALKKDNEWAAPALRRREKRNVLPSLLVLILLPWLLFSCTPSPLWDNPISPVKQTDRRLAGAWGQPGHPVLFIGHPVDGWMSFALGGGKESEQKVFGRLYVSELEGRKFVNVQILTPWDIADFYLIAEYRIEGNSLLFVALPNHDFLRKAIKDQRLSGRIEESDSGGEILILSCDSADMKAFIRSAPKESLFPESPSDVLKRIR
jgi:hypothetical protein